MSKLIGLGGYAQSGKDTVADLLVTNHGWRKTYFSKALDDALLVLNPLIPTPVSSSVPEDVFTWWTRYAEFRKVTSYDDAKQNYEVRRLLQTLGTEVGRNMLGKNVWVNAAFKEVDKLMDEGYDVAITGVRFPNEREAVVKRGGKLVWVSRIGYGPINTHASDNSLGREDFNMFVNNDWTLKELASRVAELNRLV